MLDPDGSIQRVEFFRDANANGTLERSVDELLGSDTSGGDSWTLSGVNTANWTPGSHTLLARALDDLGLASAIKRFTLKLLPPAM